MRIAVAGLGVVGGSLLKILLNANGRLGASGADIDIAAVSARNRSADRGVSLDAIKWYDDPVAMAGAEDSDVFVELMGGADGPALAAVEAALRNGKPVVTANKALLAMHGPRLARLAEEKGAPLFYEAAVAGGIPAIRALREGAGLCRVTALSGILNGTCNYILTRMAAEGLSYEDVLKDAQALGYAEADPALDVGGGDAGHKLAVLSMIAFDTAVTFGDIPVSGIEHIQSGDISAAASLGYVIRLLAQAELDETGLRLRVAPALVRENSFLARIEGPENCLIIDSEPQERICLTGPGAGGGPTASAVAADLLALARGAAGPVFNTPAERLKSIALQPHDQFVSGFYLRVKLRDQAGAVASITDTLARHDISIDSLLQPSVSGAQVQADEQARLVMTTHETSYGTIAAAAAEIAAKPFTIDAPSIIEIATG